MNEDVPDRSPSAAAACAAAIAGAGAAQADRGLRSTTRSPSAARSPRSIDSMAADFEKENPDIKVKPIYSGTYQETHRQGADRAQERQAAADSSVLLSTDMFTLIDEDAIVPIDDFVKTRRRQGVARRASSRPSC